MKIGRKTISLVILLALLIAAGVVLIKVRNINKAKIAIVHRVDELWLKVEADILAFKNLEIDLKKLNNSLRLYIDKLLDAIESQKVFSEEEKLKRYDQFVQYLLNIRREIFSDSYRQLSNPQKVEEMGKILSGINRVFRDVYNYDGNTSQPMPDSEICRKWMSEDREKLIIRLEDLPKEQAETAPPSSDIANFDIKDGKYVYNEIEADTDKIKHELTEEIKTVVNFDQLPGCLGKELEIHLHSGKMEKGILTAHDSQWLELKIVIPDGFYTMKFPKDGIREIVKIEFKKLGVALEDKKQ